MDPTAPGQVSEYFHCIPTCEIQSSPCHTVPVYYATYHHHGYQPEDNADLAVLSSPGFGSPVSEHWQYVTRTCPSNELLLNLEIVSFFVHCYKFYLKYCR
jgi:hypothetical protein